MSLISNDPGIYEQLCIFRDRKFMDLKNLGFWASVHLGDLPAAQALDIMKSKDCVIAWRQAGEGIGRLRTLIERKTGGKASSLTYLQNLQGCLYRILVH
jgi:hypothetical protein